MREKSIIRNLSAASLSIPESGSHFSQPNSLFNHCMYVLYVGAFNAFYMCILTDGSIRLEICFSAVPFMAVENLECC